MLRREMFSAINHRSLCVPLLPFQFHQYIRRDTVNVQFAFQLCSFHRIFSSCLFSLAFALSNCSFSAKVVCDLVFFELTGEILHLHISVKIVPAFFVEGWLCSCL